MIRTLVWLLGLFSCALVFWVVRPSINSNILDLISEPRFDIVKQSAKGNLVRVYLKGNSQSAFEAAKMLRESSGLNVKSPPEFESLLSKISPASLLSKEQQALLSSDNSVEQLRESIQRKLASPLSAFYTNFIDNDPLLLIPERLLGIQRDFGYEIQEGILVKQDGALLVFDLPKQLSRELQKEIISKLERVVKEVESRFSDVEIQWSGILRFADSSASRMESDLNVLSIVNIFIVISIVFYSFRSLRPFALCLLAIASGMFGGAALVVLWKGSIHLLTLGFGGSLLGACVDYPIHFLCSSKEKNRTHVLRAIFYGALTTLVAFCALLFSGFEGLIEMALFSIGSVAFTSLTVFCVFPNIKISFPNLSTVDSLCSLFARLIGAKKNLVFALVLLLVFAGAFTARVDDDIRLLQPVSQELIHSENWIQKNSGFGIPRGMLFVAADTQDKLEDSLSEVTFDLRELEKQGAIERFEGKYSLFPSPKEQNKSLKIYQSFLAKNGEKLREALSILGYEETLITKVFDVSASGSIAPDDFDLGQIGDSKFWSFILLYGELDSASLEQSIAGRGFYYESARDISKIFSDYRSKSISLVTIAYVFIYLIFIARYGLKKGSLQFLPAVLSALAGLSLLAICGVPMSFFSILALIIVLGLTIDYTIFYLEGGYARIPPSILISAITTICSFGILGFSSTPVLAHFGLTIALGVFFSLYLSHPRS